MASRSSTPGSQSLKARIAAALDSLSADPITRMIETDRLLHNGTGLSLQYYGPAHTDSDISVIFEEADVIHVGDMWWNGFHPFIDYSTGGSIDGMIRATERNLAAVTDKTIIIPGHGAVASKASLSRFTRC